MSFATAAVTLGASAISGWLGGKSKKKAAKREAKARLEMIQADKEQNLKDVAFQSGLEDYYTQLEKRDKYQGMLNYAGYGNVDKFAPNYVSSNQGPQVPQLPSA